MNGKGCALEGAGAEKENFGQMDFDVRLIVSDLDDTLIRRDKSISPYTQRVFAECAHRGIRTGFATARLLAATQAEQEILRPDFRIVSGGAMALAGKEVLFFRGMGKEETSDFLRALQRKGAEGLLAGCRERMYTNSRRFEHSPRLHTAIIRDFEKPTGEEACQVFFRLGSEEEVRGLKEVFPFFDWLRYRDGTYAVTAKGVSKASALFETARRYDIALAQTAAFGDDEGDCEMLALCGVGTAVENALPCVKRAARFVTGSNEEDGVAQFVERCILKKMV